MSGTHPSKLDFQALFEAAPGLYLALMPDAPRYTIVAASDAYTRATMTRREEILGHGVFEVFPDTPADPTATGASNLGASLERVLSQRAPDAMVVQKYDIRRPAESGGPFEERWWSLTNTPVFGPSGELVYILHALEDVTEKHHLAEAAAERGQLLARANELFDEASDGIFIADLGGRFTDVNRTACTMLGYTREELIGKTIADIIPAEDAPRLAATREHLLSSGTVQVAEWTQLRKDGTPIPVEVSSKILPDGRWQAFVRDIRERKRIERVLQESEERFRLIIDEAPIGMALVALDGRFMLVNRALCEIVGYRSAELTERTVQSITHPDDLDATLALSDRLARGDIPRYQLGKRYIRKNGSIVDIMLSGSILRGGDGAPIFYIAQIEDVTERKRTERELHDVNASLDAIIENVPLMLFVKESESLRFLRMNRAGQDLLGWTKESLVGKNDYDFWPRAQADFFIEKDRETLRSGKILDVAEEPIQTRYQGVRILHTKKVPVFDPAGKPLYLLGISEDITERTRLEKEQQLLAEAGAALGATLDYEQTLTTVARLVVRDFADWCVVVIMEDRGQTARLKVVSADPAKADLCARLEQVPIERDRPYLLRTVIETRKPLLIERLSSEQFESVAQGSEHLQALRAVHPVSVMALPLLSHGELVGALAFVSSTPSRLYGRADLRLAEALADRGALAIDNARLYRAAIQATELREQVLGVVAHDLRNPLGAILMQASALKRRGPDPERRSQKPREIIDRAATRMNALIQDLLDVARMEAGKLPIERTRLAARELIVEAAETQRPLAASSSLELRLDVARDLPEVWADHDRLLRVFENLIGNAMKFTRAGGQITVGADSREHEVVFWVADTGCGIAAENLPRVFDRFWQADRAGRHGAGLGLPIAKGIVEAHRGRIWVQSTLGRGSTFFVSIPKAHPAVDTSSHAVH